MRTTTFRTHLVQAATALSLGLMLTACGGGDGGSQIDRIVTGSSSSASSSSVDTTQFKALGKGFGGDFVAGEIDTGIEGVLSAGGMTTLSVNAVSGSNNLLTQSLDVTFNSPCIARGEATLSDATVTTTNGTASVTYTANGCVGDDEITATTSHSGTVSTARAVLTVQSDTVGSIKYDPDPNAPLLINLAGTGGQETSRVRFQVMGRTGAPMKGVEVTFTLNTQAGGLRLINPNDPSDSKTDNLSIYTDQQGYASVIVKAGTFPTTVRVTATVLANGVSTQSSQLVVSTGIPDQDSMSIAVDNFSPAGWQYNGTEVNVVVALADAFNNPAPDGTAVYFTTEGGQIEPNCLTKDNTGTCSVVWRSQDPKPLRADTRFSVDALLCTGLADTPGNRALSLCEARRAGRITILATALGNESFVDVNKNGTYDHGIDIFRTAADGGNCERNVPISSASVPSGSAIIPCDDLPAAYLDKNENFIDDDADNDSPVSSSTASDGKYNGVLCPIPPALIGTDAATWANNWPSDWPCTRQNATIRQDIVIVMSCDRPLLTNAGALPGQPGTISLAPGVAAVTGPNPTPAIPPERTTFNVTLADCNGNGLPGGTTVTLNTDALTNASADIALIGALPSSINPTSFPISVAATGTEPPHGVFYINVHVPTPTGEVVTTTAGIQVTRR